MEGSEDPTEREIRTAVRDGVVAGGLSLLSAVFWTIMSVFAALIGLQAIQFGILGSGLGAVVLIAFGLLVVGASVYLLYLIHWK